MIRRLLPVDPLDLPIVLIVLAMFTGPFYIFPSGLPQPGDVLLISVVGLVFLSQRMQVRLPPEARHMWWLLVGFVTWVVLVSASWFLLLSDGQVLQPIAYQVFNLAVFTAVLSLQPRYGAGALVALSNTAALCLGLVALSGLFTFNPSLMRQTFVFNNPVQLAYYGVLGASMFFTVPSAVKRPAWTEVVVLVIASAFVVLSASRAGVVALLPLVVHVSIRRRGGWLIPALGVVGMMLFLLAVGDLVGDATDRLTTDREGFERGYDRIWNHPYYLVLGAGEYAWYRLESGINHLELHSTFGTILFSYGLPGTTLFLAALGQIARVGGWRTMLWLSPPFVFGLTHNGLRWTDLWIFLALAAMRTSLELRAMRAPSAQPPPARAVLHPPHSPRGPRHVGTVPGS